MVWKYGKNQRSDQGGKISEKYDISTVEEKRIALIVNNAKISLGTTPGQREVETKRLKESNI